MEETESKIAKGRGKESVFLEFDLTVILGISYVLVSTM